MLSRHGGRCRFGKAERGGDKACKGCPRLRSSAAEQRDMGSQDPKRRIVITGAAGRVGTLLRTHLGRSAGYELVLVDRENRGEAAIRPDDLSRYAPEWIELFASADAVLHLAGDPRPWAPWPPLADNNVEATLNVFRAAAKHKVRRVVYASTLQTMEGYRYSCGPIAADAPPRPVSLYAASKLVGETIARNFAEEHMLSAICLRLGAVQTERAPPGGDSTAWSRSKWLSAEDLCQAFEKAILAEGVRFAILPVTSDNEAMPWDLSETRRILGYAPAKGTASQSPRLLMKIRSTLGWLHRRFLDPAWRHYWD